MTPEIREEREVLDSLQHALDFAYEQGLHEHGVPLVQMVREKLASLHEALASERLSRERAEGAAKRYERLRPYLFIDGCAGDPDWLCLAYLELPSGIDDVDVAVDRFLPHTLDPGAPSPLPEETT